MNVQQMTNDINICVEKYIHTIISICNVICHNVMKSVHFLIKIAETTISCKPCIIVWEHFCVSSVLRMDC